jgi:hypothetical protein
VVDCLFVCFLTWLSFCIIISHIKNSILCHYITVFSVLYHETGRFQFRWLSFDIHLNVKYEFQITLNFSVYSVSSKFGVVFCVPELVCWVQDSLMPGVTFQILFNVFYPKVDA